MAQCGGPVAKSTIAKEHTDAAPQETNYYCRVLKTMDRSISSESRKASKIERRSVSHQEAQLGPLVQKVSVCENGVWLGEFGVHEAHHSGQILLPEILPKSHLARIPVAGGRFRIFRW